MLALGRRTTRCVARVHTLRESACQRCYHTVPKIEHLQRGTHAGLQPLRSTEAPGARARPSVAAASLPHSSRPQAHGLLDSAPIARVDSPQHEVRPRVAATSFRTRAPLMKTVSDTSCLRARSRGHSLNVLLTSMLIQRLAPSAMMRALRRRARPLTYPTSQVPRRATYERDT